MRDPDPGRSLASAGPGRRATGGARYRRHPQRADTSLEPVAETEAGAQAYHRPGAVARGAASGHAQGAGRGRAVGEDRAANPAAELRISGAHRSARSEEHTSE